MQTLQSREVDLLILGAGAGGMATALAGAIEGLDVLVCEKSPLVGGTTSTSAGTLWIPGNSQSLAEGYNDTISAAREYLTALGLPDDARREAYLQDAPAAIDYFEQHSDVKFQACGRHPDYQDLPGAAVTGRALIPQPFDGRLLGRDFKRIRPPIPEFMILGGMMVGKADIGRLLNRFKSWSDFYYSGSLLARYVKDRLSYRRGTRLVMGNALVARLYYSLHQRAVPVLFNTVAQALIHQDGRVVGASLINDDGETETIHSRCGVVLATGGIGSNPDLRADVLKGLPADLSMACATVEGDGIELARQVGATLDSAGHRTGAFWTPVSKTKGFAGGKGLFPHLVMDRAKPGLIAVNAKGKRFVNEASSYHHFVEGMFASHQTSKTIPAYLICEAEFIHKYGLGVIYPGTRKLSAFVQAGTLYVANSIEELARRINVDANGLRRTVQFYNSDAQRGVDSEFGKGSTELNRFNGAPSHAPNPCLAPIEHGPFCAMPIWPAEIGFSAGLKTTENGLVSREDGSTIDGLYACGNDMASVMDGTYPGPGTTLGPALVFAYRIAKDAKGHCAAKAA